MCEVRIECNLVCGVSELSHVKTNTLRGEPCEHQLIKKKKKIGTLPYIFLASK